MKDLGDKRQIVLLLSVVVAVGFLFHFGYFKFTSVSFKTDAPVRVGVLLPFSGSAVGSGELMRNVLQLAREERNAQGGIHGREIEYVFKDGACGEQAARTSMEALAAEGLHYVIGGLCSGETLAAAPIANREQMILLSPTSSNPAITEAGEFVYRTSPSDADSGRQLAKEAIALEYNRAAIFYEAGRAYTQGLVDSFSNTFTTLGGSIILQETYNGENPNNPRVKQLLETIQEQQPDVLYVASQTTEAMQQVFMQAIELGLDIPYFASEDAVDNLILDLGAPLNGLIFAQPFLDENRPEVADMFDRYRARFDDNLDKLSPLYVAASYDAAMIMFDTIAYAGSDTKKAQQYLDELDGYFGVSNSRLRFDENGDANQHFALFRIEDGAALLHK